MKHLKVSFDALKRMDTATRKVIELQRAYAAQRDAIRHHHRDFGTFGCAEMTHELNAVNLVAAGKCAPYRAAIEQAYREFLTALDDAVLPDGGKISANDLALLQNKLIRTPSELRALQRRHEGNLAMQRAIEDYAERQSWGGFAGNTESYYDSRYIREFAEDRHKLAQSVVEGFDGENVVHYGAIYFEKHVDAEADYKSWADEARIYN